MSGGLGQSQEFFISNDGFTEARLSSTAFMSLSEGQCSCAGFF